ncbi:hypothetical protein CAEBREN_08946 [Caenorhabditis brenneri]|uniref:Solute carrier family 25 member 51 n=1 Tax=Caenorhabditis brenneri TaxID=135651 RepID=G0NWX0_CAEBE|nr:hypothetical protein CAEBREN_08946 [Caenorhabditis brenneri]
MKQEGIRKLYRGLLPPLIMRMNNRALMFGVYDNFESLLSCSASSNTSLTICHAQAGFLSGICEAMLCPLERVQVLLQTSKYHDQFKHTLNAFNQLRDYGYREYYRGFSVVLLRNGLSNALYFTLKGPLKQKVLELLHDTNKPSSAHEIIGDFVSGAILGAFISTLFFPLGVVKNHMQAKVGVPYDSAIQVFREVWKERNRSLRGLYLGVHLNFTRSLLAWGIITGMHGVIKRKLAQYE